MVNERLGMTQARDDYDSPWKDMLDRYFQDFMAFFFPDAYAQIDWSQPHAFLDQELQQVARDAELGRRYADKLVRVALIDGKEQWIHIHIEVQGSRDPDFAERLYVYNYRLYDRYGQPAATMAVLADEEPGWKPSAFGFELLGCRQTFQFPVAKLLDFAADDAALLDDPNPFALLTLAHLSTQATRHDMQARLDAKWALVRRLYERGWDRQRVLDLFAVIDWMMALPADLGQILWQNIEDLEKRATMRYVTSVERIYIEKGLQQGLQQGLEKGLERGRQEGESRTLVRLLERRFGSLSSDVQAKISAADVESLELWLDRVLDASSLDEVFSRPQ